MNNLIQDTKMDKILTNFLLAADKFMPEMKLRQLAALENSDFTCSACRAFTKNKKKNKNRKLIIHLSKPTR